jgi:hypothetical protein
MFFCGTQTCTEQQGHISRWISATMQNQIWTS